MNPQQNEHSIVQLTGWLHTLPEWQLRVLVVLCSLWRRGVIKSIDAETLIRVFKQEYERRIK